MLRWFPGVACRRLKAWAGVLCAALVGLSSVESGVLPCCADHVSLSRARRSYVKRWAAEDGGTLDGELETLLAALPGQWSTIAIITGFEPDAVLQVLA